MAFTDQRFLCVGEVEGSVDVEQRSNYASRKIITHFSLACFLFQLLGQIIWCSLTSIGAGGKGQIMTTYLDSVMDMRAQVCTQLFHPLHMNGGSRHGHVALWVPSCTCCCC